MLTAFISAGLFFIFLYLMGILYSEKSKEKESIENDGKNTTTDNQQLLPIPGINLFLGLAWMVVFGKGSIINFLMFIRRFGEIFECRFWVLRFALINDFQLGKELFKNPVFCGKPTNELFTFHSQGLYGVINPFGKKWKEQRKFCQQQLKDFGFGTKSMEALIHTEIDELIDHWCKKKGEVFSPNKSFYIPMVSSIWLLLAGERASAQDPKMVRLVYRAFEAFRQTLAFPEIVLLMSNYKLETMNSIQRWIPIFPGITEFQESISDLREHFETIIDDRKSKLIADQSPRDFLDAYLIEINNTTDPNSEFHGKNGEKHLLAAMLDFFMAGGDTTATMLSWTMLHLIRNPEMQEKIRNEIDIVVGIYRRPSLNDRTNCPYTEAFLAEALRFTPIAAASMPHTVMEDTNIGQYFIKQGTFLFLNIYNIHRDAKVWGDPDVFRPERFLSKDGKSVVKHEALCSFSLGQRRCVGEQVARDNLFLFVSSICQRFILKHDPRLPDKPELVDKKSAVHCPDIFHMVALDRLELKPMKVPQPFTLLKNA